MSINRWLSFMLLIPSLLLAETHTEDNFRPNFNPIVRLQTWATHSMNEDNQNGAGTAQSDIYFRRFRIGGAGKVHPSIAYTFQLHYDRLGENYLASTKGNDKGNIALWNAFLTAQLIPKSELLNLHIGYYWAAISREYNTNPWGMTSFDKTFSVWYLRSFVTAKGNGIETGAGFAGITKSNGLLNISYRTGVYNPSGHLSPNYNNLLYTGRFMLSIGDPEQTAYGYQLLGTQWGKRKGITLGFGGSYQDKVDNQLPGSDSVFFDQSIAYGTDLLIDYGPLRVDGEYYLMNRKASKMEGFNGSEWYIRSSYLFKLGKHFIEPAFMTCTYSGSGNSILFVTGNDVTYDFGVNYYLKKEKAKLTLHYITQEGRASQNTGNYIGIMLQARL